MSMLGRFAGQILNTTLGWATLLLFGKVPQQKQIVLLLMVFGSLIWVALLAGIVFPNIGKLLVAAVPRPDFIPEDWVRMGMLVGAAFVPLVIGIAAAYVAEGSSRARGFGLVKAVLRGYPFALVLALILVLLAVIASVRKIRSMSRRWEDAHVPVVVKPGRYEETLHLLEQRLDAAGLDLTPRDAGPLLSGPPKLLDVIAGRALGALIPDHMQLLVGPNIEILVYPSDLAISGEKRIVARARAAIASELTEAPAYLTTSADAQKFEDELETLGSGAAQSQPVELIRHLRGLDKKLAELAVPYEEWETLYRMRLQLERDARATLDGSEPSDPAFAPHAQALRQESGTGTASPSRLDLAIGLAGAALIVFDVALVLSDRRRRRSQR
jgi:hypothetical protein